MTKALVWFRRDLRLHDHHALYQALKDNSEVYCVFVFDQNILSKLPQKDKRITFIHQSLEDMERKLQEFSSSLFILKGNPIEAIPSFLKEKGISKLYFNRDYEPYAVKRDKEIEKKLLENQSETYTFKDSVYFEGNEIQNKQGKTYKVFTPFKRAWYEAFNDQGGVILEYKVNLRSLARVKNSNSILKQDWHKELGFIESKPPLKGGYSEGLKRLKNFEKNISDYDEARNFPALDKTSNISAYIRHGNVSVRDLLRRGMTGKDNGHLIWTSEVIWREFYQGILSNFPHVVKNSFKPEYDKIKWIGGSKEFKAWSEGQTGFPIIDSAMRCLNETGLMHNRLRMIVASFLCKTLLVDWRKGERYFAEKLLDFDLAANNGGWQWSASTGTDAQPYFRIFNPYSQSEKFDPEGDFIKEWCPELAKCNKKTIHNPSVMNMLEQSEAGCTLGIDYPLPIVDYKLKRQEALNMYKKALN